MLLLLLPVFWAAAAVGPGYRDAPMAEADGALHIAPRPEETPALRPGAGPGLAWARPSQRPGAHGRSGSGPSVVPPVAADPGHLVSAGITAEPGAPTWICERRPGCPARGPPRRD